MRHLVDHFSVAMGPCKTAADPVTEVSFNDGLAAHKEGHVRCQLSGSKSYAEPKSTVLGFSKGCMELMYIWIPGCLHCQSLSIQILWNLRIPLQALAFELGTCRALETK